MQGLVFWMVYPILWLISILPFRIFYVVSDAIFVLVYHIVGYRRKIVKANLRLVFPEKAESEIRNIEKKFYKHMCDMFLEMIKSISISEKEIKKRFICTNPEYLKELEKLDKSIIVMCGHYASYEWMNAIQLYGLRFKTFAIYKKIKNKYFDQLAADIRGRYEGILISTREATEKISENEKKGIRGNYAMIADQSPKNPSSRNWIHFMGIKVPVFTGSERLARKMDMSVVYLNVEKKARGFYEATLIPITEDAPSEPEHFITKRFIELLEKQIRRKPEYYLWTHKRWKHRNEPIPENADIMN